MKNLAKKTNGQNTQTTATFANMKMDVKTLKQVKGGDDIIIVEDVPNI